MIYAITGATIHWEWKLRRENFRGAGKRIGSHPWSPEMRCSSTHTLENETRTDASVEEKYWTEFRSVLLKQWSIVKIITPISIITSKNYILESLRMRLMDCGKWCYQISCFISQILKHTSYSKKLKNMRIAR